MNGHVHGIYVTLETLVLAANERKKPHERIKHAGQHDIGEEIKNDHQRPREPAAVGENHAGGNPPTNANKKKHEDFPRTLEHCAYLIVVRHRIATIAVAH